MTGFLSSASASHYRFGHLNWKPRLDIAPNTVEFGGTSVSAYVTVTATNKVKGIFNPNFSNSFGEEKV